MKITKAVAMLRKINELKNRREDAWLNKEEDPSYVVEYHDLNREINRIEKGFVRDARGTILDWKGELPA